MTRQELIRLYTDGQLPRRDFVRRLTLAGVSAGAAVAYAQTLAPSAGAAAVGTAGHELIFGYGGDIPPGEIDDIIAALVDLLDAIIDFFSAALDNFDGSDFADFLGGVRDVLADLQTLGDQLQAERDTLGAASASVAGLAPVKRRLVASRLAQSQTPDDFIADLGDVLDIQCRLYAGLIADADDSELRGQLASLAIVKGEQAAYVRTLRGTSPFPSAVETPIDVETARTQIEAIIG